MTLALLIAGIFAVVAGFLSILFGFSVREFSLGSPLIISGTIGVCSGMLLVGLYVVVMELKAIARRLAGAPSEVRVRPVLPALAASGTAAPEPMPAAAARNETRMEPPPPPPAGGPPPWQSEAAARERPRVEVPPEPEAAPPATPEAPRRRNLMFASTSRKERERAEAKSEASPEPGEAPDIPPASFDDAWPKPDRSRPPEPPSAARRPPPRSPSTFAEATPPPAPEPPPPPPSPPPPAEQAPVTVLKSGIVDGMAYSLYSDGSIEAQMPEGMMRFASIDELRTHLDQRS